MTVQVSMRDMLQAGVHFGHRKRYWDPKMGKYIFGASHDVHIINLEYTKTALNEALKYISQVAAHKGKILFVGTKRAASAIVAEEAKRCGMPYVDHRWLGGMLTNWKTIRLSIKRLKELEKMREEGLIEKMIKKEGLTVTRELEKLERSLGGIKNMGSLPDVLFIIDTGNEDIAVLEANRLKIPVIGIVDTNNNPDPIDYVIPGNDDSQRANLLYCKAVADTILAAKSGGAEAEIAMDAAPVQSSAAAGE